LISGPLATFPSRRFSHNYDVSCLLAAVSQPAVVKATVASALVLGPKGVADRKMLLTHSNFLPVRKSATAIFGLQQQINNARGSRRRAYGTVAVESDIIAFGSAQRGKILPVTVDAKSQREPRPGEAQVKSQ
jgi:hypothetical protein